MTVVHRGQDLVEAMRTLLEADAEIRTLCDGRTSGIVRPWSDAVVDPPIPVIAYALIDGGLATSAPNGTEGYEIQCSCFAKTRKVANALQRRIPQVLTWSAWNSRGLDACLDPTRLAYRLFWPEHDPLPDAPAKARADVSLYLLVTA
jgi:hypothetical protein